MGWRRGADVHSVRGLPAWLEAIVFVRSRFPGAPEGEEGGSLCVSQPAGRLGAGLLRDLCETALPPAQRGTSNVDAVLNGIAYDGKHRKLYVTGKLWPKLYEIELVQIRR